MKITIERHNGVNVLRDDLLPGGTKACFIGELLDPAFDCHVYASPVYGAFQIALAEYCRENNRRAVIFCAKRGQPHENTLRAKAAGARVLQVPYGYLSNVQAKARRFCGENNGQYLKFGGGEEIVIQRIAERARAVFKALGGVPDEIFCAVGSGTLLRGIERAANGTPCKITGVCVGAEFTGSHSGNTRLVKYPLPFDKPAKGIAPFKTSRNYDLKAWEVCLKNRGGGEALFWNVF